MAVLCCCCFPLRCNGLFVGHVLLPVQGTALEHLLDPLGLFVPVEQDHKEKIYQMNVLNLNVRLRNKTSI